MSATMSIADRTARSLEPDGSSEATRLRSLASGRSVLLTATEAGEELQIRSPNGELEVRITLGPGGPVVHVSGARLELDAPDTIAFRCRQLDVETVEGIRLASAGNIQLAGEEMRVQTAGDIHMNADFIRLNC
jgi:hypothetical protein